MTHAELAVRWRDHTRGEGLARKTRGVSSTPSSCIPLTPRRAARMATSYSIATPATSTRTVTPEDVDKKAAPVGPLEGRIYQQQHIGLVAVVGCAVRIWMLWMGVPGVPTGPGALLGIASVSGGRELLPCSVWIR